MHKVYIIDVNIPVDNNVTKQYIAKRVKYEKEIPNIQYLFVGYSLKVIPCTIGQLGTVTQESSIGLSQLEFLSRPGLSPSHLRRTVPRQTHTLRRFVAGLQNAARREAVQTILFLGDKRTLKIV